MSLSRVRERWPQLPDGTYITGPKLFELIQDDSPVPPLWDLRSVIEEVEENFGADVEDVTGFECGYANQALWCDLSNGEEILARLGHSDVNKPDSESYPVDTQLSDAKYEAALYEILLPESSEIKVAPLLYHRVPQVVPGPPSQDPTDILGRRFCVFEAPEGSASEWHKLDAEDKILYLRQAAHMRAALFNFNAPRAFISRFLAERIPHFSTPIHLSTPITPTRDFCIALLNAKIEATITNLGDPIGWPTDNNVVGPFAAAAKQSLLRLVPFLLPPETRHGTFYRLVIDHGDYGMWNMTSTIDEDQKPLITSLFGWDMSSIVPAIFSDLKLGVEIDLVADDYGNPAITRLPHNASATKRARYKVWCRQYIT
ncbi:hypothetical protein EIK77_000477, partial [Talaromyces pinophilus]